MGGIYYGVKRCISHALARARTRLHFQVLLQPPDYESTSHLVMQLSTASDLGQRHIIIPILEMDVNTACVPVVIKEAPGRGGKAYKQMTQGVESKLYKGLLNPGGAFILETGEGLDSSFRYLQHCYKKEKHCSPFCIGQDMRQYHYFGAKQI